jgi:hypothetical protein
MYGRGPKGVAGDVEVYERYLPKLLDSFQQSQGDLISEYYCGDVVGGAGLTKGRDGSYTLHTVNDLATQATAPVAALIPRCERLCVDASRFLPEPERGTHAKQIFSVATYLLSLFNDSSVPNKVTAEDAKAGLSLQREEFGRIEKELARLGQREGRFHYFWGMTVGVCLAAAVAVAATILLYCLTDVSAHTRDEVMVAFCAGALGAFVSVLARMTRGSLQLSYRAGKHYLYLLGAFRPVIGSLMALALTFLVLSGILDIFKVPDDTAGKFFFFGSIGFLAGFSERWAQDMLAIPQTATTPAADSGLATPVATSPASPAGPDDAEPTATLPKPPEAEGSAPTAETTGPGGQATGPNETES